MKNFLIAKLVISLLFVGIFSTRTAQSACVYGRANLSGGCCTNFVPNASWLGAVQSLEQTWNAPATCTYGPAPTYGYCYVGFYYGSSCSTPPPTSPDEGAGGTPSCPACSVGNPINLITGNTYIRQTDLNLPGLSGGLSLTRTWNSVWPSSQSLINAGAYGPNWRSTYEERVFTGDDGTVKYSRSDGSFWSFILVGLPSNEPSYAAYQLLAPANGSVTLSFSLNQQQTALQWVLTFQNGEQRTFDPVSGFLTSIVDRNGNATQVSYDSQNRLATVTDPASRHLYFSYGNNSSTLVTGVTSDFGTALSYAYDGQGRLAQVTEPDLTTISFAYDGNSMITTVTDSNGKVLESHTYDSFGRGLTSSKANGVEAVTVSYPNQ